MKNLEKIIMELKKNGYYNISSYIRTYPDNLKAKTKGYFQIILSESMTKYTFEIIAVENNFTLDSFDFYNTFKTEQDLYKHIENFLSKFKDMNDLSVYLFLKFGFIKQNDPIIDTYSIIKDDLEDGSTLEDFIEKFNRRC